ncbi:MAG: shikimate kinase [Chitinophagaceae bacterium]
MGSFPIQIYLIGLMGSGKSYWGRQLAFHFHYPFLDLDKGIEMAEKRTISDIFEKDGEKAFREKERQTLHQLTKDYSKFVMSCGGGTPCFFDNMEWMTSTGTVIWLKPPMEVLAERLITAKDKRPLIRHASNQADIVSILSNLMVDRLESYNQSHFIVEEPYPTIETFEKILNHA